MRHHPRISFFLAAALFCAVFPTWGSAADHQLPNRIAKAKAGEWVQYKLTREISRRFTVVEMLTDAEGDKVKLRSETLMMDQPIKTEENVHLLANANVLLQKYQGGNFEVGAAVIAVKGEDVEATTITGRKDGVAYTVYFSDAVPVFGMTRMDIMGEKLFEADAFGFGDE